ncbi:MAG: hypothetical protein CMF41_02775 [Legionellales bacterium]|nr:hypothetical protein [Legionellales bacterium]OUX65430.1 MAG: hypothetical protein CBE41_01570 [Gammaproteobacteria bacterium TMED281]
MPHTGKKSLPDIFSDMHHFNLDLYQKFITLVESLGAKYDDDESGTQFVDYVLEFTSYKKKIAPSFGLAYLCKILRIDIEMAVTQFNDNSVYKNLFTSDIIPNEKRIQIQTLCTFTSEDDETIQLISYDSDTQKFTLETNPTKSNVQSLLIEMIGIALILKSITDSKDQYTIAKRFKDQIALAPETGNLHNLMVALFKSCIPLKEETKHEIKHFRCLKKMPGDKNVQPFQDVLETDLLLHQSREPVEVLFPISVGYSIYEQQSEMKKLINAIGRLRIQILPTLFISDQWHEFTYEAQELLFPKKADNGYSEHINDAVLHATDQLNTEKEGPTSMQVENGYSEQKEEENLRTKATREGADWIENHSEHFKEVSGSVERKIFERCENFPSYDEVDGICKENFSEDPLKEVMNFEKTKFANKAKTIFFVKRLYNVGELQHKIECLDKLNSNFNSFISGTELSPYKGMDLKKNPLIKSYIETNFDRFKKIESPKDQQNILHRITELKAKLADEQKEYNNDDIFGKDMAKDFFLNVSSSSMSHFRRFYEGEDFEKYINDHLTEEIFGLSIKYNLLTAGMILYYSSAVETNCRYNAYYGQEQGYMKDLKKVIKVIQSEGNAKTICDPEFLKNRSRRSNSNSPSRNSKSDGGTSNTDSIKAHSMFPSDPNTDPTCRTLVYAPSN